MPPCVFVGCFLCWCIGVCTRIPQRMTPFVYEKHEDTDRCMLLGGGGISWVGLNAHVLSTGQLCLVSRAVPVLLGAR